jgi:hypothetical protein
MANLLESVELYVESGLPFLNNCSPWINLGNKKFNNFEDYEYNRGTQITYSLPPKAIANVGTLNVTFTGVQERARTLAVTGEANVGNSYTAQDLTFTLNNNTPVDDIRKFLDANIIELGAQVSADLAQAALKNTYRSYGGSSDPLTSYGAYANAIASYRNRGAARYNTCAIVPDIEIAQVINAGANQFTPERNNDGVKYWELGSFDGTHFYPSNIIAQQNAGTVGNNAEELTLTSVDPTGTILTFSGASASEPIAIAENDIITLDPQGATNFTGLYFLLYTGHLPSRAKVQVRATANAASDGGGNVTVTVDPPLIYTPTDPNSNINLDLTTLYGVLNSTVAPSHLAGLLMSGDPFFTAFPRLPDTTPFVGMTETDKVTGLSMRAYYGKIFTQNEYGLVTDLVWGYDLVPDQAMRLIYPLT